ncbi:MAG: hypothetical protein RBR87_14695 [Bacteroidales bacterium]|jgi:hypothetical protein|nr:hypothetical protein [Bacteroidales bacterium]
MNKLIIFSISLLMLMVSAYSQESRYIDINYVVNGKVKKMKNNSKILFIQNGDTIESKICCGKIHLPNIDSNCVADVLFLIGKNELFFATISTKKLLLNQKVIWELGYYRRFGDKEKVEFYQINDFSQIKELYYWKFKPQEFGDGTITLVTVPKD